MFDRKKWKIDYDKKHRRNQQVAFYDNENDKKLWAFLQKCPNKCGTIKEALTIYMVIREGIK